jgi:hypothetical protein
MPENLVKVGEWFQVKPLSDILATLDNNGCLDGMPFMPEMVQFCGQSFKVVKSAHKTCDPTGQTDLRSLPNTVHFPTRCDGSAHDGCEARCLIYWKREWLKQANGPTDTAPTTDHAPQSLVEATRKDTPTGVRYMCQATEIVAASKEIPRYDVKNYLEDVRTGNVSSRTMGWNVSVASMQTVGSKLRRMLKLRRRPRVEEIKPTNTEPLNLQIGEMVRVKPIEEIRSTLKNGKNKGLSFENEMAKYCGKVYQVLGHVTKLIDEKTGRMLNLKNDCIILHGIVCGGLENRFRLFCPRSPYLYWREAWLERMDRSTPVTLAIRQKNETV